jgi:hypothetical protein
MGWCISSRDLYRERRHRRAAEQPNGADAPGGPCENVTGMSSGRPVLFRKRQFEPAVIVTCVRWYLRLTWVSYCDTLREIIAWPRQRRLVQVFVDAVAHSR